MRVLHYGNFSTVWKLRELQRNHGIDARVLDVNPSGLLFRSDYLVPHKASTGVLDRVAWFAYVLSIVSKFDLIHFHGGLGRSRARIAAFARNLGKKIVIHYRGIDLRESIRPDYQDLADAIIVSTPDLRKFCKEATYVPNPVEPLPPRPFPNSPVKILHAHTSRPDREKIDGSETIMRVLRELESEQGYEVIEVVDAPHDEAISIYRNAHIAVDQLVCGWYGVFAVECMLMEIPVLAYIDNTVGKPPILSVTKRTLKDKLLRLAGDSEEMRELGSIQREYASSHHDPEKVFSQVQRVYASCV